MSISDWSSDVCSSDLAAQDGRDARADDLIVAVHSAERLDFLRDVGRRLKRDEHAASLIGEPRSGVQVDAGAAGGIYDQCVDRARIDAVLDPRQIGRASIRDRVWRYV